MIGWIREASAWASVRSHAVGRVAVGLTCLVLLAAGCASTPASQSPAPAPASAPATKPPLRLVVLGDSIPNNSAEDCPGCNGFVDQYAEAIAQGTGREVETANLSEHTGLTMPDLLEKLPGLESQIQGADVILIGIAHNSIVLATDRPCGATFDEETNTISDWSKLDARCAKTSAAKYKPVYEELLSRVAELRAGKPTALRALNKYNDWIGWEDAHLTPDQQRRTRDIHNAWNDMLCDAAQDNGFECVDIYHAFNGPDGSKAAGSLLADDYTHPSEEGNAVIAKTLIGSGLTPLTAR